MAFNKAFGQENKFQDEFVQNLRLHGAYVTSVVGSTYCSGQPDLSIVSKYGQETKVENKVYRGLDVPDREKIIALLKGPQRGVILHQLFRRNANCLIIAQCAAKPDTVFIVSASRFSVALATEAAKVLAYLPWGSYTPYQ